ncbi:MAG TPA: hypothetical protein PK990_04455 [Salinivirgaceae bacterium]|nr:hypothetical protein [Salinivirgaceae bacterium]
MKRVRLKYRRVNHWLLILLGILLVNEGCFIKRNQSVKVFEYKIRYLISSDENPVISLLPVKMTVLYHPQYIYYHTEGWMGFFSTSQLVNLKDSTRTIMTKFLDKKYAHIQKICDTPLSFVSSLDYEFIDTAFCVDYNQEKAWQQNISIREEASKNKIIYTHKYNIKNPNIGSPFEKIDGLLVFFPLSTLGIPMELELTSVRDTTYNDSMFIIPASYQLIERDEMERIVSEFSPK